MKNTTILISILLVTTLIMFIKTKEQFENNNSEIKNNLIHNIDTTIDKMNNNYKVFNDETANMANKQTTIFVGLSIITLLVFIFTIWYVKR
jgi:preprotein translocase subunit SecY